MTVASKPVEMLLASERAWPFVLGVVAVLTLAGWSYLGAMVIDMVPLMDMGEAGPGMGIFNLFNDFWGLPAEARAALAVLCLPENVTTFGMPGGAWGLPDVFKVFLMWFAMVLAMMLPSTVPMLRAYVVSETRSGQAARDITRNAVLVGSGYIAVWTAYAIVATTAQWALTGLNVLGAMMAPISLAVTASVLIAAGLYQFTPAKQACLARCWYPRWVFLHAGAKGRSYSAPLREGLVQGLLCLGCCWAMMTVMFAVGIMNVIWIAFLGALMAVEKTFPSRFFAPALGVLFLGWGGGLALAIYSGLAS
ncbi:DUF2182 domain-containing protein [Roseibium sp. RKSG952]|nr:DUF2182 domain-containing protein [Roseibium sp. RKSG952]